MDAVELDKRFPISESDNEIHVTSSVRSLAEMIDSECSDGREKSLALTKLEEVSMWAICSIDRNSR